MIIANTILLQEFAERHAMAAKPINRWLTIVENAQWKSHNDLKIQFPQADYVGNARYVFNLSGNHFRLVAIVMFIAGVLDIRFVGTHAEYDRIPDCSTI